MAGKRTKAEPEKAEWPGSSAELRALADLVPNPSNARTHSPEQVDEIAASIREWGFTNPILVDEAGGILAGHGRRLAALKLGLVQVPVVVARGWTDAQKRAYILADNRIAQNAGWDLDNLAKELDALRKDSFDLSLTGFNDEDLKNMMGHAGPSGVVEIPVTEVDDRFWISLRGPLADQARVLQMVKAIAKELPTVELDLGVISLEP
jgi:ParB-like chromosome segregation protein Spo0J